MGSQNTFILSFAFADIILKSHHSYPIRFYSKKIYKNLGKVFSNNNWYAYINKREAGEWNTKVDLAEK